VVRRSDLCRSCEGLRRNLALADALRPIAGTAGMSWVTFLRFNVLGAVVWATAMGPVGFAAGRGAHRVGAAVGGSALVLLAMVRAAMGFGWALGPCPLCRARPEIPIAEAHRYGPGGESMGAKIGRGTRD
jgi:hypothetical protein